MSAPLDTVPVPLPPLPTVSVAVGRLVNAASSETFCTIVNVHVSEVPAHAPVHEPKEEIASDCAVKVTVVPGAYVCVQVEPHVSPDPDTGPPTDRARATVNVS